MSSIRLNDIWRGVNKEIGFYTVETFKNIPAAPGIYAWFYPLRIVTEDLYEFMNDVNIVLNYDCETKEKPWREFSVNFSWDTFSQRVDFHTKKADLSSFENIWHETVKKENDFDELRKIMMRASLFLPPLYVGKTTNLRSRCQQHINGTSGDNNFHKRFEEYAFLNNFTAKKVSDLLFVAIKTKEEDQQSTRTEELVESILKYLSKPKYSKI
jgi:predicted GIY-YIG superfamily endonuclease